MTSAKRRDKVTSTKTYKDITALYHKNPSKLNHSNLITVLTHRSKGKTLQKQFVVDESGEWELQNFDNIIPFYYTYQVYNVPTLEAFSDLLKDIEDNPKKCIVYGLPHPKWKPGKTLRRQKKTLLGRKTSWLILDIDKMGMKGFDLRKDPNIYFKKILRRLSIIDGIPANAAAIWHLSSSYGKPGSSTPKVHVILRLSAPVKVARIALWQKHINKKYKKKKLHIDPAVTTPNQILYTAKPRFIGEETNTVNFLNEMERVYITQGSKVNATNLVMDVPEVTKRSARPAHPGDEEEFEYVLRKLQENGLVVSTEPNREGKWNVICPYASQHSVNNESSTTIAQPNDKYGPQFWCMHENTHKDHKLSWSWFLKELTRDEIIDPTEIRKIRQDVARQEFKPITENNVSDWYADQIQENYIYIETEDAFFNTKTRVKLSAGAFGRIHGPVWLSDRHKETEKNPLSASRAFFRKDMNLEGGRSVAREMWKPGTDELIVNDNYHSALNSWYGFPLEPAPGECSMFYKHIALLLPDKEEQKIFLDFLAHTFQKPEERPTWAIVHVFPKQGLGRGRLHTLICNMLGNMARTVKLKDLVESQYNPYLYKSLWVGTEETLQRSANSGSEDLKEMITAETANINLKYGGMYEGIPIYARHFFMTNHLNALPIDPYDRRFWICGPNSLDYQIESPDYYVELTELIYDIHFQKAVMWDLLARDISGFNPGKVPKKSDLAYKMIEATMPIVDEAFDYVRTNENYPPIAPVKEVKRWIQEYAKNNASGDSHVNNADMSNKIASLPWYKYNKEDEDKPTLVTTSQGRLRMKILRNAKTILNKNPKSIAKVYNRYLKKEFNDV